MILNLRGMFDSNCIQIRIFYLTREYLKQLLKIVFFFSISFRCCSVNLLIDLFSFKRNIKLNIVIRENFLRNILQSFISGTNCAQPKILRQIFEDKNRRTCWNMDAWEAKRMFQNSMEVFSDWNKGILCNMIFKIGFYSVIIKENNSRHL